MILSYYVRVRRVALLLPLFMFVAIATAALGAFPAPAPAADRQFVVAIDAGHQARGNSRTEPLGPGSRTRKPKVTSGTSGVATHKAESLINLQVALTLHTLLEEQGVDVVMIRNSQNVNIANSKRARIASAANADLLIRLHCDAAGSRNRGVLTLVPGKNRWTGPILTPSARAGSAVHHAVLAATGAKNRGIRRRTDMSGFNWSTVPSIIVEMGVMTNRTDDRLLASQTYQRELATGMASGIMTYLAAQ